MKHIVLIIFGILILSCQGEKKNEASDLKVDQRPNIIWLMAEDISTDLGSYGMAGVKTPHLDQMASEGMRFTNCFVTSPICSPSRSAMMTGTHQVKINAHHHRSNRDVPLSGPYKPFTYWLREAGYTCILGHHGVLGKGRKTDVNFKHQKTGSWDGIAHFGLFDKLDNFDPVDAPFFAQIQLNASHRGDWWDRIRSESENQVNTDDIDLPPYYATHPAIKLDWAKYLDQIEYVDGEVGMILQELEDKGLADNTIVIFIGDNGRCNLRGKGYLHDPGLRVPLIIKGGKDIKQGTVTDQVVSATDITATILNLAQVEIPAYMTGSSFLSADFNREEVYAARDLWDEIEEQSRAVVTDRWKYIRNDMPEVPWDAHQAYLDFFRPAVHVMRQLKDMGKLDGHQEKFFSSRKPVEELYDLQNDPFELYNLVPDITYEPTLEMMRIKLNEYEVAMTPVSDIYKPIVPKAVDILEWVKAEKPELYQQMLVGKEIGFQGLAAEFRRRK
ncbi:MAG: N-sulfoglucosamine sulfohydrolase [Saprospiraceae bacterium]